MSRQAFYSLQWLGCIPEWCSTHYSGYESDTHAVSWLLTAVVSVISGFSSANPRVSRPLS
ncbi:hypothetical protein GSA70_003465 [Salmonella enterica]|nr:hypothetical protein [Salmonella enterica subsp. enterica serovar Newport]EBR2821644.1 hypothetical protein [Salmonella enterica]EDZ6270348.1 hypothetical protein [Salmonella enterica]EEJ5632507.1 hypothetical protein [Salmonella enterica]